MSKMEEVGDGSKDVSLRLSLSSLVLEESARRKPTTVARRTSGPTRRSTKGNWTPEEDALLAEAVKKHNYKNWKCVAAIFRNRTDVQCLHRWQKVLNPDLIKGAWTKEEDAQIISLVEKHGSKNWSMIATFLPGRIGKQCRERWHNHLNPDIRKDAWTEEEDKILLRAHRKYGNKWAEIAKFLPGRSDNSIKNYWNCNLGKRSREESTVIEMQSDRSFKQKRDAVFYPSPSVNDTSSPSGSNNEIDEFRLSGYKRKSSISSSPCSSPPLEEATTPNSVSSSSSKFSLYFGSTPSSLQSVLKKAAENFETPSIIKRRSPMAASYGFDGSGGSGSGSGSGSKIEFKYVGFFLDNDFSQQGKKDDSVSNESKIVLTTEEFSGLPRDFLKIGLCDAAEKSVGKRLEADFDMEWEASSKQQ